MGYRVDFRPGWDCHRMPTERQALEQLGFPSHATVSRDKVREAAKTMVKECMSKQKQAFASWGVMADFSTSKYMTTTPVYEAKQIELFGRLFENGFIYRARKPVYWSPSSQTCLAEADLEYIPTHQSTAVYVTFPVKERSDKLRQLLPPQFSHLDWFAVIWTTTPWSLPGNDAIAYDPELRYTLAVAQRHGSVAVYIVGETQLPKIRAEMDLEFITDNITFSGRELQDLTYCHPLNSSRHCPFVAADHVTLSNGTGLIHIAPAHGHVDYRVGVKHKLNITTCLVDAQGNFTKEAGECLAGRAVLSDGTDAVIDLLKCSGFLLGRKQFTHSYPYDRRSKTPVLLRDSEQWFIDVDKIRQPALDALEKVVMIPKSGKGIMTAQLNGRPYWCISRQGVWGVPIPVFYSAASGKPLINHSSIEHIGQLVRSHGADVWWTASDDVLFPASVRKSFGLTPGEELIKGRDMLDSWFESGTSWATILGEDKMADLCIEGNDQYGTWLQTSLLTSVALRDKAPFKKVFVYGSVLDEKGEKMSNWLGNAVQPDWVTQKYGVDVLRWWVAQGTSGSSCFLIGPDILDEVKTSLTKLRNTFCVLLGYVYGFWAPRAQRKLAELRNMPRIDQNMLELCQCFVGNSRRHYEDMEYHKVTQEILRFTQGDDLSFYLSAVKDRMLYEPADSPIHASAQTTLFGTLLAIVSAAAPITPILADEVYRHLCDVCGGASRTDLLRETLAKRGDRSFPLLSSDQLFGSISPEPSPVQTVVKILLAVRSQINQACAGSDVAKMSLRLQPKHDVVFALLESLNGGPHADHGCSELHEIFGAAQVSVEPWTETNEDWLDNKREMTVHVPGGHSLIYRFSLEPTLCTQCSRCGKYNATAEDDLCVRCRHVTLKSTTA